MESDKGAVIRLGRAILDLNRGTLHRDGVLVPVRHKTFVLLRFLAENAGRVLSKDEIMTAVWPDVVVTEDSLTQAVRDARRAIGDEDQSVVRTVPRRGYLLAVEDAPAPAAEPTADRIDDAAPKLAILPFRIDPSLAAEIDGDILAEDTANAIACFRTVVVVAWPLAERASADADADADGVGAARRSGADFAVETTLRRAGGLEVAVSLTDLRSGRRAWSRRFSVAADDLSDLPAAVATLVASHVVATVEHSVAGEGVRGPAANGRAYAHLIRGRTLLRSYGPGVNEAAKAEFARAVALDPGSGLAAAYLAFSDVVIAGYQDAPRPVLERSRDEAIRAMLLSPLDARCQRIFSTILIFLREYSAAEEAYRRAFELNPYDPDTLAHLAFCCAMRGRPEEALRWLDRATRLNPLHPDWYNLHRHIALYLTGRYAESVAALERIPRRSPWQNARLAAARALAGQDAKAAEALAETLAVDPGFDVDAFAENMNLERREDREHFRRGLRRAAELVALGRVRTEPTDGRHPFVD